MRVAALAITLATLTGFFEPAAGQNRSPLVGTWQRFAHKTSNGRVDQPPLPTAVLIFGADGYYSQTAVPDERAKTSRPLSQLTLKEMLQRFENAEARYGRYSIKGDTLARTVGASLEPANVKTNPQLQVYRIRGDTLILRSTIRGDRTEAKFRRLR